MSNGNLKQLYSKESVSRMSKPAPKSKPALKSEDTNQPSRAMPSAKERAKSKFQESDSDRNAAYPQNDDEQMQRKELAEDNNDSSIDEENESDSAEEAKSLSKAPKQGLKSRPLQSKALSLANALANEHERRSKKK